MFKRILLPTDGSELSEKAISQGIQLASRLDAKVTGVHVIPEFSVLTYKPNMLAGTRDQYIKESNLQAARFLDFVQTAAAQAGVTCDVVTITSDEPHQAILKAAEDKGCDLIAMASHGRKGIKGVLLGSETQKVLTHSIVPVLVIR